MRPDSVAYGQSPPACACGTAKAWRDCWNCDEGLSGHDCGEDCCCCLDPEDNVRCDICAGKGGFFVCERCYPEDDA